MDDLYLRLIALAVEYGELEDGGEIKLAEQLGEQIEPLLVRLRDDSRSDDELRRLAFADRRCWVRYFAATAIVLRFPKEAEAAFAELSGIDGMVSLRARLSLSATRDMQRPKS